MVFGGKGIVILARCLEPAVDVRDGPIGNLDLLAPFDDKVRGDAARAGAGWTAPTFRHLKLTIPNSPGAAPSGIRAGYGTTTPPRLHGPAGLDCRNLGSAAGVRPYCRGAVDERNVTNRCATCRCGVDHPACRRGRDASGPAADRVAGQRGREKLHTRFRRHTLIERPSTVWPTRPS